MKVALKQLYASWKEIAEKIGNFQTSLVFTLLFFILVLPTGLLIRLFKDYLGLRGDPKWEEIEDNTSSIDKLTLQ